MQQLILTLRPPSKAAQDTDRSGGHLLIDGTPAWGRFPPWGSCPDILFESESRVLCGVAYGVHPKFRVLVKDLVALMDHAAVRYREFRADNAARDVASVPASPPDPKAIPWTAQHFPDWDYVEVVWSVNRPDTCGLAQLADDTWFYTGSWDVLALRIRYLDEITETYDLTLPDHFALPALEVSYLD